MLRNATLLATSLLAATAMSTTAQAAEPGFRLAGHSGVSSVAENETYRVSRGTDDLVFVWFKQSGAPRSWRRIEPDALLLLQGERVGLFGDDRLEWLALPTLESAEHEQIAGSVGCRGTTQIWSWTEEGVVSLHDSKGSEQLERRANPGEDASCLVSPLGTVLIWSDETGVAALVHGATTQLVRATTANDGLIDASASATGLWASVRAAGSDKVMRTTLLGDAPADTAPSSGWRTCDTFDAAGEPLPCTTLRPDAAAPVSRPIVPAWSAAAWQDNRLALSAPEGAPALVQSEAGWAAFAAKNDGLPSNDGIQRDAVVRGRRLVWRPTWMAGCAQQAWIVEERSGEVANRVAGPICGVAPRWVPTPDDRSAVLQLPDRGAALVWSDRAQPSRLPLPEASDLQLTMALRSESGWWLADATHSRAWKQGGGDAPAWTDAAVPLLADRSITLSKEGEVLTLQAANHEIPITHFLVTDRGTAAWQDDGSWWADDALRPQLVWVASDGLPFPTDDPTVERRFAKRLVDRLWDQLVDER